MPHLFTPITLRSVTAKNRIVIAPMCQYSAENGFANDWHLVHLGKFAQGGAGVVMVEATAVVAEGRITYGDVGLWSDEHVAPLRRIAAFLRGQGSVPAIQLAHAGRKASARRPWVGGAPLGADDGKRGESAWPVVAPSPIPVDDGWQKPHELSVGEMETLREKWRQAALRAREAEFDVLEIHCAHGYLMHEFLSPLSNLRTDAYGGDRAGRMRFPLEVIEAVRSAWPKELPLFVRVSSIDGLDGGVELDDSIAFAREAKARGVDAIDCSSGGLFGSATVVRIPRGYGFQVPFAEAIRREAGIATMAVGLIVHPQQAEDILAQDKADLIAIAREALFDPNWPLHAELALTQRDKFESWPPPYGFWLEKREPGLRKLQGPALPFRNG